jgi:indoleamine 2,3-dioxygenase
MNPNGKDLIPFSHFFPTPIYGEEIYQKRYDWTSFSCSSKRYKILPASLSIPLIDASDHFGLPPVLTYTALCLWNHNVGPGQDELDSLSTRMTFTGSVDESWFYLVSVIIEARGGIMVSLLLECLDAANDGEVLLVIERLERTSAILVELKTLLLRVYEKCRPRIFYDEFRPFLAGSKGTEALRRGVLLEDRNGSRFHGQYSGGSAGQSSLFQFLDITLGTRNARGLDDGFFKVFPFRGVDTC